MKIALFNEEQLRAWHAQTGLGPMDHPLLQPDQPDVRGHAEGAGEGFTAPSTHWGDPAQVGT